MMIAGGGSGGHIYPALSIVEAIRSHDPHGEVLYVGTRHGLEAELVVRARIPFQAISAQGLLVKGIGGKVRGALAAARGLWDAVRLIRRFRPDVVVGTGGYVSGPVGLAAAWLKVPLVIQEQNAWPGLTNRWLGKMAAHVVVPFDQTRQYFPAATPISVLNNPVTVHNRETRAAAREALGLKSNAVLVMVTGGSQGALAINQFVINILPSIQENPTWGLVWATGKRYFKEVNREMARSEWKIDHNRIQVVEYFYEIQRVYRAADLFLGRAGAMTLADCQAFGVPAILVPSPHVSEDHQTKNAMAMERLGKAVVLRETDLGERGWETVRELLTQADRRQQMGSLCRQGFDPHAAEKIADIVRALARAQKGERPGGLGTNSRRPT